MTRNRPTILALETLENRTVPAIINVISNGADLTVVTDDTATNVGLTAVGGNQVAVTDNNVAFAGSPFTVTKNLTVITGTGDDTVTLALNTHDLNASVNIDLGAGNNLLSVTDNASGGGDLNGTLRAVAGGGNDVFLLGNAVPVALNGAVEILAGDGDNFFATGNLLAGGAIIRGNLTYDGGADADTFVLDTTTVTGDVVVNFGAGIDLGSGNNNRGQFVAGFYGHVFLNGNLTVTATGTGQANVDIDNTIIQGDVNLLLADGTSSLYLGVDNNSGMHALNDQTIFFSDLNIVTGAGNDTITVAPRDYIDDELNISSGGGTDRLFVGGTVGSDSDSASAVIDTGAGDDSVTVDQIKVTGDLVVRLGEGTNTLRLGYIGGVFVREDVVVTGGTGDDTINIDDTVVGSDAVFTLGDGLNNIRFSPADNTFGINDATVFFGNLSITAGAGTDVISIGDKQQTVVRGNLNVDAGDGTNVVGTGNQAAGRASIGGDVVIHTGVGSDNVFLDSATVAGNVSVNLSDGLNQFASTILGSTSIGHGLAVTGGLGDDMVTLASLTVNNSVILDLGDGANRVQIGEAAGRPVMIFDNLVINTGAGLDTVSINSAQLTTVFVDDDIHINTGASSDTVASFATIGTDSAGGNLLIGTNGGVDTVVLGGTLRRRLEVLLGDGDDTLTYNAGFAVPNLGVFSGLADGGNGAADRNTNAALNAGIAAQITSVRFEL